MKNILKCWYFEWLDKNRHIVLNQTVIQKIESLITEKDLQQTVEWWVQYHAQNNIHYTHFVSACANNPQLIDGIVESIKRKQLN